ncbi:MAG: serine--tRNA ligase [bacterium]|nr:serine--tRNA ligase [bacterium]
MLDIKYIRENATAVRDAAIAKGFDASCIDELLVIDEKRRESMAKVEELRAARNKTADAKNIEEGKRIKSDLKEHELVLDTLSARFEELMLKVPNPSAPDVIVGSPEENEVIKAVGTIPVFDFPVRDHLDIGLLTNTIDLERGAKVAQSGFYYIKGDGAFLELALTQYVARKLADKGFQFMITPNVAKERNVVGCGFQARSDAERQIYHIEDDDLDLIGTSEITLVGQHADEILPSEQLPLKYAGFSSCYRREIGSYGKDVRGILRVHEFRKIEMVVFCAPEESDAWHEKLLEIEEEIWQELGIPYQVVKMATGDLGNAATRKYDVEAWMPSQEKYREVTSASNTTDFQTRRLSIRTKVDGKTVYPHSLNGTALALGRAMIAIYENYQQADGSVVIPTVLRSIMGKEKIGLGNC